MRYIDLHCDTVAMVVAPSGSGERLRDASGHLSALGLAAAGAHAQVFALFIPDRDEAIRCGFPQCPWESYQLLVERYRTELADCADLLAPALFPGDLEKNRLSGRVSAILAVEGGALLDGKVDRLRRLHRDGVRILTITWNYENCLGFPHSAKAADHARGLKPFGLDALELMDELGIAADCSHLSEGGFWDVARHSKRPLLASHSCARELCPHSRNLSDRQLAAIGQSGGIAGINFNAPFLRPRARLARMEDIVRHAAHMVDVAGAETPALGSDFDGVSCRLELGGCEGVPSLIERLAQSLGEQTAERIAYKNAERFFAELL